MFDCRVMYIIKELIKHPNTTHVKNYVHQWLGLSITYGEATYEELSGCQFQTESEEEGICGPTQTVPQLEPDVTNCNPSLCGQCKNSYNIHKQQR